MGIVFLFFLKKFGEGFLVGVAIRVIIAVISRTDATLKGCFMSGLLSGAMYALLTYYMIVN